MARLASGDDLAEAELAELFSPRIRAMMLARVRDPELARDLAQDALMALLQALRQGQLRDHDRLPGFAHGVARNVVNNYFRTKQREPLSTPIDEELAIAAPAEDREQLEKLALLRRGLEELSPSDREILQMTLAD